MYGATRQHEGEQVSDYQHPDRNNEPEPPVLSIGGGTGANKILNAAAGRGGELHAEKEQIAERHQTGPERHAPPALINPTGKQPPDCGGATDGPREHPPVAVVNGANDGPELEHRQEQGDPGTEGHAPPEHPEQLVAGMFTRGGGAGFA